MPLATALRRTWAPALALAVVLAAGGFVMQSAVASADSIGDVGRAVRR